jgi:choline kinase
MKILVLAAGKGSRFKGYSTIPKPFIKVNGKEIIKRTTDSLSIKEPYRNWNFAVQAKHRLRNRLKKLYSKDVSIIDFDFLTRGNLETAYESSLDFFDDKTENLLILDSDNAYDGFGLIEKFNKIKNGAAICYFQPIDNSPKWGFAFQDKENLYDIREKDPNALRDGGKPMIGTFFFSSIELFESLANKVLENHNTVRNEYYMTQSIKEALIQKISVKSFEVKNVIPLGTPEDVEKAKLLLQ